MKVKGSVWFTVMGGPTFGIVYGEDEKTHERKAYIGTATPRTMRVEDEENIAMTGGRVHPAMLREVLTYLETKERKMVNLNQATTITAAELETVMVFHPWSPEKVEKGNAVRKVLSEAVRVIIENVPPSPDRSTAIRKIREARMDANSAITHNGQF